jgi:P-type E1-E2 ATPase
VTIDSDDLVVGDIVKIEFGKTVPADCILFESVDLSCSEGNLTGEPEAIHKSHITP